MSGPMKPASSAAPIAASSRRIDSVASARTAMNASSAPIANAAIATPSMTAERVGLDQRPVRLRRRIGAVAVGDDVAPRRVGLGAQPPLLAGREAGAAAAAQARRGDRRRSCPVGPRSWTARLRPANAPAATAASSAAAGSRAAGARRAGAPPACASRIDGQPLRRLEDRRHRAQACARSPPARPSLPRRPARPCRAAGERRVQAGEVRTPRSAAGRRSRRPGRVAGRLEPEVAVVRGRAVDHRVPRAGLLADPLERRDRQVAVGRLGRLEDLEHLLGVVVELLEDLVDGGRVDPLEVVVGVVGDRPAGAPQRRLVAPLAVRLGRAPVDVVAALRVDPAHVDALDRAGLGALEAGLALERAPLVVEQLEAAAELVAGRRP